MVIMRINRISLGNPLRIFTTLANYQVNWLFYPPCSPTILIRYKGFILRGSTLSEIIKATLSLASLIRSCHLCLNSPLMILQLSLGELLVDETAYDAINFTSVAHQRLVRLCFVHLFCFTGRFIENARTDSIIIIRVASYSTDVGVKLAEFTASLRYQALRCLVSVDFCSKLAYLVLIQCS